VVVVRDLGVELYRLRESLLGVFILLHFAQVGQDVAFSVVILELLAGLLGLLSASLVFDQLLVVVGVSVAFSLPLLVVFLGVVVAGVLAPLLVLVAG